MVTITCLADFPSVPPAAPEEEQAESTPPKANEATPIPVIWENALRVSVLLIRRTPLKTSDVTDLKSVTSL